MKKYSIVLQDKELEKIDSLANKRVPSTQQAVEGFLYLREQNLVELMGKFFPDEIKVLAECFKGALFNAEFASDKNVFNSTLDRYFKLNKTALKVETDALKNTIDSLSSANIFFLQYEIWRFWNLPGSFDNDFEKFFHQFWDSEAEE